MISFETICIIIMIFSIPFCVFGALDLTLYYEKIRGWILIIIGVIFLFAPAIIFFTVYKNDTSKLSKEIENKEIVSIEMNGLENSSNGSTYDSINSIVYIDDDGAKTKLDCSRYHLFDAKVEESADKKYHIAINKKTLRVTVYIPAGQSYTSK
ncbi:MAG: hypothetical protein K6B67_05650 [Lachnospiraceae bacterium]|nr:hypothetical protein [Lachnospiraceae bacterium]